MKNNSVKYDVISYIEDLREAGFNEAQAKAQAKGLFLVIEEQLVSKRDLKELEDKLTRDIKAIEIKLQFDIKGLEVRLLLKLGSLMILLFGGFGAYIKILLH